MSTVCTICKGPNPVPVYKSRYMDVRICGLCWNAEAFILVCGGCGSSWPMLSPFGSPCPYCGRPLIPGGAFIPFKGARP